MKEDKDTRIQCYAAKIILNNLESLQKSVKGIITHDDIEDIHDLRVATRRIRTALDIFSTLFSKKKTKTWQDGMRTITRQFGKSRDLDVQIDFLEHFLDTIQDRHHLAGIRRIYLRLIQKRNAIESSLGKHTADILKDKAFDDLCTSMQKAVIEDEQSCFPQELFQLAFNTILTTLDQFLYYEIFIQYPEKVHELHLMRIAAKKLRYTLEIFLPLYEGKMDIFLDVMRSVQQQLGEIRDCDVWLSFIPAFLEKEKQRTARYYGNTAVMRRLNPGIKYLYENRHAERQSKYCHFIQQWRTWRSQDIWPHLRDLIFQATLRDENERTNSSPDPTTSNTNT